MANFMLFRPVETGEVAKGVYAVRSLMVNCYVLDAGTDGALIVFDTGINPWLTAQGFKKLGLDSDKVSHVFLTHSDYDHQGGLKLFKNAAVYLSAAEEPMITHRRPRTFIKYNRRLRNYHTLNDAQTVAAGKRRVRLISTPGHTPGSACYWVNDDILITGDTLRLNNDGQISPFLFLMNMDHAADWRAIEKLRTDGWLDRASVILTGHTGVRHKGRETAR